jgi:hypothetical protein
MHVRLLGPCFKTGRSKPLRQYPKRALVHVRAPFVHNRLRAATCFLRPADPSRFRYPLSLSAAPSRPIPLTLPCRLLLPPDKLTLTPPAFDRFPFDNFTYSLTLFSKFFSSFPHGTCSLSVSRHYLALDGIYHPFWSAFPNKPTRPMSLAHSRCRHTGFSPSVMSRSREPCRLRCQKRLGKTTILAILNLSCSRFTRRYWGNPCWFLFLCLMICLSSAGDLA